MADPQSILELIATRTEASPEAVALLGDGRSPLTYRGLRDQIELTVAQLAGAGVGRGDRVALVLENGPELAAAFLASCSAGVSAPLNPAYRESEFEFFLADLRARAVVVDAESDSPARGVAMDKGIRVIELERLPGSEAGTFRLVGGDRSAAGAAPPPSAESEALVLHTSGTTARPKIVPLSHGNLLASAASVASTLGLDPADRCLNVMPLFHVHGLVAAVLATLWAGGSVVCSPGFEPESFFRQLDEHEPTWYTAVPTVHQAVLDAAPRHAQLLRRRPLRLIRSSSAALPPRLLGSLEGAFGCPVVEAYGMTEAAHQMACNPLPPGERKPGSVGVAQGPEIAVLDERGLPVPAGAVGEVAIRGANVFAGYEANSEANAAAFADDWFRTGDEGVLDEDGYLFLRGRLKEIINRGGEKISPREVDEVLLDHPAVAQAVTFSVPHARLGESVATAVVLAPGKTVTEPALREFASMRLTDYKVPARVVFVDTIPKGATGKLQRIGLAERLGLGLGVASGSDTTPDAAPATPLERRLAALWAELLGFDGIGRDESFFDLGGESILAARMLVRIAEEGLGPPDLPLSTLLWAPTVAELAEVLETDGWEAPGRSLVPLRAGGEEPPLFIAHDHFGTIVEYGALARALRPGRPVYGLEWREPENGDAITIEELASAYAAEIRALRPEGPYLLAGACLGAVISLEVARALAAEGKEIGAVVLVSPVGEWPGRLRRWRRKLVHHYRSGNLGAALRRAAAWRVRNARRRVGLPPGDDDRPTSPPQLLVARSRYRPHPYAGQVALIRSRDYLTPNRFWEERAEGGLLVYGLSQGLGLSLREPGLAGLAEQIDRALDDAAAAARSGRG